LKILCTGANGFVGSNLVPKLRECGFEVICLERYLTGRYSEDALVADLNDHAKIRDIVAKLKPEYVIHLAAISPVAYSYEHYAEVLRTNFTASVNLFEACRELDPNLIQLLCAGTSEEYGVQSEFPIKETADLRPNSPYAVSKVAMDRYLQYLEEAYKFPMTLLRPFNSYGRSTNKHFVVERIISQMLNDEPVVKLGDPEPTRDLLYIDDHVYAYLTCLGNEDAIHRTFNFCTGIGTTIRELADKLCHMTGYSGLIRWNTIPKRPLDIPRLIGNNWKARRLLGWVPKVNLETGLESTIQMLRGQLCQPIVEQPKSTS